MARAVAALKAQRSISRKRLALVEYAGRHDAPAPATLRRGVRLRLDRLGPGACRFHASTRIHRNALVPVGGWIGRRGRRGNPTVSVPSLTPGQSHTQELALMLPAGTYFLIVKADATSAVAEASETNNTQEARKSS